MNTELKLMLFFTRNLPRVRGAGWVANRIKEIYNRKPRSCEKINVLGFEVALEPAECVDGALLFYPQLYDYNEMLFLKNNLNEGDVFLDAGANIGIYSLVASKLVGSSGSVVAVEADEYNANKLSENLRLNNIDNVDIVRVGLSDKVEHLVMHQNLNGNRGGNTLLGNGHEGPLVTCKPLNDVLVSHGVERLDGMKMDIEGFEEKVLKSFFQQSESSLWPKFIIIEINQHYKTSEEIDALLRLHGYDLALKLGLNMIYRLLK